MNPGRRHRVRVELPAPLLRHAKITTGHEVVLEVESPATIQGVLDAIEAAHPTLRGTIRDQTTHKRRDFIRFFVEQEDWSHNAGNDPLPESIAEGREPLIILGAIAGG